MLLKLIVNPIYESFFYTGICGRTGAGKSSLMVALLRMAPLMSGAVYLDGVNISTVPLQTLRSVIAIIPQV